MEEQILREQSALLDSKDYIEWKQLCDKYIELLEELIKRPQLSIGNRHSLSARIACLKELKNSVRRRFAGAGCSARQNGLVWREIDTAFESRVSTGAVINYNHIEPRQFLDDAKDIVIEHVQDVMKKHYNVKVNTIFNGEFVTGDKRANESVDTRNYELFRTSDLREWYERRVIETTLASLEEFQERDSGWALSRILNLTVNINKYNPLRVGCHIELPREIMMKRAVINVQSEDNACFAWAVVAALYPAERNAKRKSSYPNYETVLNLQDIEFPVTLNQIKKFEHANDISINVYSIEDKNIIVPLQPSQQKRDKHVNLLYIEDNNSVGHFAWIKNLSRLLSSQLSKHNGQIYICDRCLHYFYSDAKLQSHTVNCGKMNDCTVRLPSHKDKWLSFNNFNWKKRLPFIVYADLKCVLAKTEEEQLYQHHQVFSIAYYVHCSFDESLSAYYSHRSVNCIALFAADLKNLAIRVNNILKTNVPINLTSDESEKFRNATQCHICEKPFAQDDKLCFIILYDNCIDNGQPTGGNSTRKRHRGRSSQGKSETKHPAIADSGKTINETRKVASPDVAPPTIKRMRVCSPLIPTGKDDSKIFIGPVIRPAIT
ncbi:uncharacterized protein LOC105250885 [Camponotus floridanus]|uniref:uncharacterized protein LOC105250885 n=1 Tax=Camponotus floridanus TaxID=104421 RepID=UPI000DC6BB9C|nr:uncharacterized protein LOC105250885 [Camponotus floridanus]